MGWLMPPAQAMAMWSVASWGPDGAVGCADANTVAALQAAAAAAAQAMSASAKLAAIDAAAVAAALSYAASASQAADVDVPIGLHALHFSSTAGHTRFLRGA